MREILVQIWEFIRTYWREIVTIIGAIICFIASVIRRRPKAQIDVMAELKELLLENIPNFINLVESPGDGASKLDAVVKMCLEYISKLLKRELTIGENQYFTAFVVDSVEKVLSTPQRKEN